MGYEGGIVDTNIGKYTWLFDYHGKTASKDLGAVKYPAYGAAKNGYVGRKNKLVNSTTVEAVVLSWTTGTITMTATGGPIKTIMHRAGGDARSEFGAGEIQMVSPMLTRWVG